MRRINPPTIFRESGEPPPRALRLPATAHPRRKQQRSVVLNSARVILTITKMLNAVSQLQPTWVSRGCSHVAAGASLENCLAGDGDIGCGQSQVSPPLESSSVEGGDGGQVALSSFISSGAGEVEGTGAGEG